MLANIEIDLSKISEESLKKLADPMVQAKLKVITERAVPQDQLRKNRKIDCCHVLGNEIEVPRAFAKDGMDVSGSMAI